MTILIDRGHSYTAPGASGYALETDLTHRWGIELHNTILGLGGQSLLLNDGATRDDDLRVPVKQANALGKDNLFVSIHCNAHKDPTAKGFETFMYKGTTNAKSKELLNALHTAYGAVAKGAGMIDRGTKTADFYVLRETVMPAALIELGFVTNANDARLLKDESFMKSSLLAMAKALMRVAGQSEKPSPDQGKLVAGATYVILSRLDLKKALDVRKTTNAVIIWDRHDGRNQQWEYTGEGFKSVETGKMLDIENGSKSVGAQLCVYPAHGGTNQQFYVTQDLAISTPRNGMVLDIANGTSKNGTKVIMWPYTGGKNQLWYFVRIS